MTRLTQITRCAAVAALLAVAACDAGPDISAPEGPDLLSARGGACYVGGSTNVQLWDTGLELTMSFEKSGEIGPEGGTISIGASRMEVPAGAVTDPAVFTMNITTGQHILAEFTATSVATGEPVTQFAVPVHVEIGYQRVQGIDPQTLVFVWLLDETVDGRRQEIPTQVDEVRKRIMADLDHFSLYAIGIN